MTGKPTTLLVVDDEALVRSSTRRSLERLGHQVLLAENGPRALELFEEHRDQISLVLLDFVMPMMDGSETFARLQELEPGVRVLLISGQAPEGTAESLLQAGVRGYLEKPFTMQSLAAEIERVLSEGPVAADS